MTSFQPRTRPGWEDVQPIAQAEAPEPVAAIQYTEEFDEMMGLFRAAVKNGELSERVLELTEDLLTKNEGNYTVWQYRRECLRALRWDLTKELDYMDSFAEENPKNYQIWHHRRAVVEMHGSGARELDFTAYVFKVDPKNYHAWAHRQWVLATYNLWDGELEYIEELLRDDVRNNSAWNQRWFVVHRGGASVTPLPPDVVQRELDFALAAIDRVSKNESAWNYVRGLARYHPESLPRIRAKCAEFDITVPSSSHGSNADRDRRRSKTGNPHALSLLADLREAEGSAESLAHAAALFAALQTADAIRLKFWTQRADTIQLKLAAL